MCSRQIIPIALVAVCTCFLVIPFCGADEPKANVPSISDLRIAGLRGLEKHDAATACDAADRLLLNYESNPIAIRLAGDLYLRSGKIRSSLTQFERFIELKPAEKAELWQYGVALALAGKYEEGRKLFELHRSANPNDVENAAWHFLCVAKHVGVKEAKKLVLPAPGDTRVPMNEIRRLLIDGDDQRVTDAVNQLSEGSEGRTAATFYANLYTGLYADAIGNPAKAKRLVGEAAKTEQVNYMADIARVYLTELEATK